MSWSKDSLLSKGLNWADFSVLANHVDFYRPCHVQLSWFALLIQSSQYTIFYHSNPFHSDGFSNEHIDAMSMDCPFCILRGHRSNFLHFNIFLPLKIGFIFANTAGPDEMPHYMAFHQGLLCCQSTCFQIFRMKRANKHTYSLSSDLDRQKISA